ncbi:MAG: flagellar brake domain-containing protein [candidate division Zixibacteria bacterium]|nr:flagellar brake domain-containing protein [candidate division Zixibacteria bacterium]
MLQVMLQNTQPLRVWEKIEILVGEGAEMGKYMSRIEDFINNGILITQPEFVEGRTLLREGVSVTVRVTRDDAAYQFFSTVKQVSKHNKKFLILSPPKNIQRVQRRLFVRVDMSDRVLYTNLAPVLDDVKNAENLKWQETNSLDISGGGMLLRLQDEVKVRDLLLLQIGYFKESELPGYMVGLCKRTCKKNNKLCAGLEFVRSDQIDRYLSRKQQKALPAVIRDFDYKAQDKLVNLIFHKQIELRQKGLL